MSTAPRFDIDPDAFWRDPYPALARLRAEAPIAHVPQLGSTLFTRRDDIFSCEKIIDVFSSHQPTGLMNRLMGHNMMRKDGDAHMAERKAIFPSVSPRRSRGTGPQRSRRMPIASLTSWLPSAAPILSRPSRCRCRRNVSRPSRASPTCVSRTWTRGRRA
jgi:cytochrome P450